MAICRALRSIGGSQEFVLLSRSATPRTVSASSIYWLSTGRHFRRRSSSRKWLRRLVTIIWPKSPATNLVAASPSRRSPNAASRIVTAIVRRPIISPAFLPILNSRRCQLLDNKRLASQLCSLERRASRVGSKDSIGHPPLGHDDLAAAVAGLMVRLVGTRDWQIKTFHAPLPGISRTELCALVEQDILNNTGLGLPGCGYDSSAPPGGWPMGSPQAGGFDAQFSWSINRTHKRTN